MAVSLVDWDLAAATATRLVRPGPAVSYTEATAVVSELKEVAAEAAAHVRRFTALDVAEPPGEVAVLDRPDWVRSNVAGFRTVVDPLIAELLERRQGVTPATLASVGARVTGVQAGGLLAYLATRVLGQYEVFRPGDAPGRLTLVAPNIVAAEQAMGVVPRDFRMWVALHEVTHRIQFAAVPWLRDHVLALVREFLLASDLEPGAVAARLRGALSGLADSVRGRGELSLVEIVQTPEQRAVLERVTGLMSLLEGHAEFVMDGVGPEIVATVADLRRRFDARRAGANPLERTLRRLLGLEMKLRQYAEGSRFTREVVAAVGVTGFNQVWSTPDTLPSAAEIRSPGSWLERVLPGAAPASA